MEQHQSAPLSLQIVAALFILGGISAIIDVIIRLSQGQIFLNFGVLGLFIGVGLLHFSPGWRTCALVFLWIALIGLPLVALAFLFVEGPFNYVLFGQQYGEAPRVVAVALVAVMFALALWQYRVLTRPDIRNMFGVYP